MASRSLPMAAQVRAKGFPDMWSVQLVTSEAVSVSPGRGFTSRGRWCQQRPGLHQLCSPQAAQGVF